MIEQQKKQKLKKVEELKNFPFKTFVELKKATTEGIVNIGIDRGVALQWVQNGIYLSSQIRVQALILTFIPFIATIGFVVYAAITKSWFLFFALPVLLICFFVFHPSSAIIFGFIRGGLIGLVFIGLAWGLISGIGWLIALATTLFFIWYAQRTIYKKAVNGLTLAVLEHEDLFCILWQGKVLNVMFFNGNRYWVDWKVEDGQSVHYKNK